VGGKAGEVASRWGESGEGGGRGGGEEVELEYKLLSNTFWKRRRNLLVEEVEEQSLFTEPSPSLSPLIGSSDSMLDVT